MDFETARAIVESEDVIEVVHNGLPVWIKRLNPEDQTATIRPVNETDGEGFDVSVTQLVAGRILHRGS